MVFLIHTVMVYGYVTGMDVILRGGDAALQEWARSYGIESAPQTVEEWKQRQLLKGELTEEERAAIEATSFGSLTYRVTGGIFDFSFYLSGLNAATTPNAITAEYHASIGLPHLPPFWSLGFHQCRWGYPDLATVEGVVNAYAEAKIPLETMWTDIDYMYVHVHALVLKQKHASHCIVCREPSASAPGSFSVLYPLVLVCSAALPFDIMCTGTNIVISRLIPSISPPPI
jgi:hypothetical protein